MAKTSKQFRGKWNYCYKRTVQYIKNFKNDFSGNMITKIFGLNFEIN